MAIVTGEIYAKATSPKGKILKVFTPIEDFYDEELESHYLKGYLYYVRENNPKLAKKASMWVRQKRANYIEDAI